MKNKIFCLIPARSGSKRIKNKNIVNFYGKPIIAYSIIAAIKSRLFQEVYVSTDSKKISKIAKRYGAKIPFLRPRNISNDHSNDDQVINHFLKYMKNKKIKLDTLCYLYPVAPLIKISTLKRCLKLLKKSKNNSVMTVTKINHSIQRVLRKNKKNQMVWQNKKFINTRSQDLEKFYQDAAQCYWHKIKNYKKVKKNNLKISGVELSGMEAKDINTSEDLAFLKLLYKFTSKKHKN
tara:strand:+ start:3295 stop:3999 length:705 start_codon:yes stop_codon:yes gene_type:complete